MLHLCGRASEWITKCRLKWHKKLKVFWQCGQVNGSFSPSIGCVIRFPGMHAFPWGTISPAPLNKSASGKLCRVLKCKTNSERLRHTSPQTWHVFLTNACGSTAAGSCRAENTAKSDYHRASIRPIVRLPYPCKLYRSDNWSCYTECSRRLFLTTS